MANINWGFIIDSLKNSKTVLLLGPEICVTEDGKFHEQALLDHLKTLDGFENIEYYDRDGLFFFKDPIFKTMNLHEFKAFYNKDFKDNVYSILTEIPFNLVISTTPDHNLHRVFESKKKDLCKFEFYHKKVAPKDITTPTNEAPLIYNLFGSKDHGESLILTHEDLFDFLDSILGKYPLPDELRSMLQTANNFVFLGFKFSRWYVQLLLRMLEQHNKNSVFIRFASNDDIKEETQTLIKDQFKITFVEDQIEAFVNELHKKCDEAGILREIQAEDKVDDEVDDGKVHKLVLAAISKGEVDEALALIKEFADKAVDTNLQNLYASISGANSLLKNDKGAGILTIENYNVALAQIIGRVNVLNEQIKQLEEAED